MPRPRKIFFFTLNENNTILHVHTTTYIYLPTGGWMEKTIGYCIPITHFFRRHRASSWLLLFVCVYSQVRIKVEKGRSWKIESVNVSTTIHCTEKNASYCVTIYFWLTSSSFFHEMKRIYLSRGNSSKWLSLGERIFVFFPGFGCVFLGGYF